MVGYQSPKSFYESLKHETGLTPSDIRNLAESAVRRLLDVTLAMPSRIAATRPNVIEA
jgi:AraC-like DNA-binding protein